MADLEELRKKLYKPGAKFEERPQAPEVFEPGKAEEYRSGKREWAEQPSQKWRLAGPQKKFIFRGLIILAIVLLGTAGFMFWRGLSFFDTQKVNLRILGPERVVSGEEVIYTIQYKNNTKIVLEDVELFFEYPEGAIPLSEQGALRGSIQIISLNNLAPQEEGVLELKAQLAGLKGDQKKAMVRLNYHPENIESFFENRAEFESSIVSVPLILNFDLPEKIVSGQIINISLQYLNASEVAFNDLKLKIDYPTDFVFVSALPEPDEENNVWSFNQISRQEEGKILISGLLTGQPNEIKPFQAKIGVLQDEKLVVYSESLSSTQISASPLNVSQIINLSEDYLANPGDLLKYKIKYQNTVEAGINNVIITARLISPVLDFSSLLIEKGFFNSLNNTITWNAASLSDLEFLEPHAEGEINFSVKVKEQLPINNFNDKNFTIESLVKIDSSNVPLSLIGTQLGGESKLIIKLNSRLILNVKGYYQDNLIPNSGPLPPRVGQITTYTLYWQVINLANDLENIIVEAYLPSYVQWMNKIEPQDADLKFNPSTGKITWAIHNLPAGTGILSPVKFAAFQIGLVPAITQVNQVVSLIGQSLAQAKDVFTGADLKAVYQELKSNLPDDAFITWEKGRVGE